VQAAGGKTAGTVMMREQEESEFQIFMNINEQEQYLIRQEFKAYF
jgi:hypothetical protein